MAGPETPRFDETGFFDVRELRKMLGEKELPNKEAPKLVKAPEKQEGKEPEPMAMEFREDPDPTGMFSIEDVDRKLKEEARRQEIKRISEEIVKLLGENNEKA